MSTCDSWWMLHCAWPGLASILVGVLVYWILYRATHRS